MGSVFRFLSSTILSKVVMAITGVVLIGFVLGHMAGNLQIFIGRERLNHYAEALQNMGALLWVLRIFLSACLVLHITTSIRLKLLNMAARPVPYTIKATVAASISSRTMLISGITVFAFLTFHLLHFTIGSIQPGTFKTAIPLHEGLPDVYSMVVYGFQNTVVSVSYIVLVLLLGFHLNHAIPSMFQTLGFNHPRYNGFVSGLGPVLSIIVTLGYLAIPLAVMAGLVTLPAGVLL